MVEALSYSTEELRDDLVANVADHNRTRMVWEQARGTHGSLYETRGSRLRDDYQPGLFSKVLPKWPGRDTLGPQRFAESEVAGVIQW